jgi:LacI family transcriptional regulator
MPTIRDIARIAGVSVSTVSLAFSQPQRVSPETLARVQKTAAEMGYAIDPVARILAGGRSRLLGMVVADISNPFFGSLLKEVERCAAAAGYLVILSDSGGSPERERAILELMASQRVAGVALSPCRCDAGTARFLETLRMPLVLFDQKVDTLDNDFVGTDNRLASAMLTRHLLQLGHRRIGYVGGTGGLYTSRERQRGFFETMRAAGIEPDPDLVVDGQYEGDAAYTAAMRLLTGGKAPTAIVAANNLMALGTLQATYDLGFRCPQDVSIASIDDVPWSAVISPRLTSAVQEPTRLGQLAAERLLERIGDRAGKDCPAEDFIVPPLFKLGGSCADLRSTPQALSDAAPP